MKNSFMNRLYRVLIGAGCLIVLVMIAVATKNHWLPLLSKVDPRNQGTEDTASAENHEGHDHAHEGHGHAGHDESSSLELSEQARRNIGLTDDMIQPIQLKTFTRTLNVPALVVELPGVTQVQVVSPMTGVISSVHALQGEAVQPGTLLFKVQLTHEDLVQSQVMFLKTLGELDVEDSEIARLTDLGLSGVIAGKTLLARKYSKQKLQAALSAHRESLLLHGLSSEQIDSIISDRRLLRELDVRAPNLPSHSTNAKPMAGQIDLANSQNPSTSTAVEDTEASHLFVVQKVNVSSGSMIQAGNALAVLADFDRLYIEGRAFEHDADEITHASRMQTAGKPGWGITAIRENNGQGSKVIGGLKIVYVDNEIEANSRAQRFFVSLPNQVDQDTLTSDGHRFLTWRFKPGQRMQLQVPVEEWQNRIVLPVDAIAQEGAETFVFLQNGDHFDRRSVHVEHRDQLWVVIANDGSLFPGDTVAITGAHQMQVALKNKAGGGVDPHAGHNH